MDPYQKLDRFTAHGFQGVDEAVDLVAGHADDEPLLVGDARKIRNKIDWVILPLLFALYTRRYPGILHIRLD